MSESSALAKILAHGGIRPFYQPIVELNKGVLNVHHLECLTRGPVNTNMEAANVLFDYVRLKREEIAVDRACVTAAFAASDRLAPGTKFSVNVHASTLGRDSRFVAFLLEKLQLHHLEPAQVSVEVVEHAPPWDSQTFLHALATLRTNGISIALDDVGLGQSNFKMIMDVRPDFLKIDRYFVHGCSNDPNRQAVIESIGLLASRFGAEVIAEGVESIEDVRYLRKLGISLFQGFLFGLPSPADAYEEMQLSVAPDSDELIFPPSLDSANAAM